MTSYTIDHNSRSICATESDGSQRIATLTTDIYNPVMAMLNRLQAAYLSNEIFYAEYNQQRETLLSLALRTWED